MRNYNSQIINAPEGLTAREKIMLKDTSDAISIDEQTQASETGAFEIDYAYHVTLQVHNEDAENKDYTKFIIMDKSGVKYTTASENLISTLEDIVTDMLDAGEDDIRIKFYRKDSKNYKGKQFLTCSLV